MFHPRQSIMNVVIPLSFIIIIIIITIIIFTRLARHSMSIAVQRRIAGADGLPWWSPSQVLAAVILCVQCVCVRVNTPASIYIKIRIITNV